MIREKAVSGLDGMVRKAAQKLRSAEQHIPRESGGTHILRDNSHSLSIVLQAADVETESLGLRIPAHTHPLHHYPQCVSCSPMLQAPPGSPFPSLMMPATQVT